MQQHNSLITCDACSSAFHQQCHQPAISDELLIDVEGMWFCWECSGGGKKKKKEVSTVSAETQRRNGRRKSVARSGKKLPAGKCDPEVNADVSKSAHANNDPMPVVAEPDTSTTVSVSWTMTGRAVRKPNRFLSPPPDTRQSAKKPATKPKRQVPVIEKENEPPETLRRNSQGKRQNVAESSSSSMPATKKIRVGGTIQAESRAVTLKSKSTPKNTTALPKERKVPTKYGHKGNQPPRKESNDASGKTKKSKTHAKDTSRNATTTQAKKSAQPHRHHWKANCPCCVEEGDGEIQDIRDVFSTFGTSVRMRKVRVAR